MITAGDRSLSRATQIAALLGIQGTPTRQGGGWSNDVWRYDEAVVRVATRPGRGPLATEALIAPRLPAAVGYPRVLGTGMISGHDWMALERLPGDNLEAGWARLGSDERSAAVADLWTRLEAVPGADLTGLTLPPTPLYAFDHDQLDRQLTVARPIIGGAMATRVAMITERGLGALRLVPTGLVHTDAVLANAVWTGSAAIPIDFEFGCVGPIDLDADCVGRDVVERGDPRVIARLRERLGATLARPGALDRLRAYAALRDVWAVGKWVERDPSLTDAATWAPVCALLADAAGAGWVDQLLDVSP